MKYNLEILNKYIEDGLLECQSHPTLPLKIYNYSRDWQFEKKWDDITLAMRGTVLDNEGNLVAKSFNKFFNYEEIGNLPNEKFDVYEKLDGCCHEDTVLITNEGEKTIKEICETDFSGEVLSYNIDNNNIEFKTILTTSILENNNDWYELELDNGIEIKLTGNHKVYLPELKCYRRVDELNGDEVFLIYEKVD